MPGTQDLVKTCNSASNKEGDEDGDSGNKITYSQPVSQPHVHILQLPEALLHSTAEEYMAGFWTNTNYFP